VSLELISEKDYSMKIIFSLVLSKVLLVDHLRQHFLVISLLREIVRAEYDVQPQLIFIFIAAYLGITLSFELGYHF
jgi:hypothetical protein